VTRRRVLLGLFAVFVVAAAAFNAALGPRAGTPESDPRVSIYSTASRGARAAYLWLEELGYPTRAWRKPLGALWPAQQCVFVLEPTEEVTAGNRAALLEWVRAGGTLFLSPGMRDGWAEDLEPWVALEADDTDASHVRGDRVVPEEHERWRYREAAPDERGLYAYPVEEVAVRGTRRVVDATGDHSILFARDGLGVAAEIYLGDGMMLVFPEADLFTNRGLAKAHNVEFLASLVEDWIEPGTTLWFDEYDHGARVAASLPAFLLQRRPALFGLALLAVGALVVMRYGRALTVRARDDRRRRRPNEFVDALGGLYARARAVRPAHRALAEAGRRATRNELAGLRVAGAEASERERNVEAVMAAAAVPAPTEKDLVRLAGAVSALLGGGKRKQGDRLDGE
jgi:hypothetical protein